MNVLLDTHAMHIQIVTNERMTAKVNRYLVYT